MNTLTDEQKLWIRRSRNFTRQIIRIFKMEGYHGLAEQAEQLECRLTDIVDSWEDN